MFRGRTDLCRSDTRQQILQIPAAIRLARSRAAALALPAEYR
jgi:hypothetical protein